MICFCFSFQETLLFVSWGFCVKLSKPFVLKPSVNQYGFIHSGNATNGQITSERSATPLLPDFMDSSKCYLHNYYPSAAYYYGGYDETSNNWDDYLRCVNPEGVKMISKE